MQNPEHHGEGNVYAHTRMVCRALADHTDFHALDGRRKAEIFLAAVLHDIGKGKTTRLEEGRWQSPHHASTGARMVRAFLWRECGLGGDPELAGFREAVCALVRWHMLPPYLMMKDHPERQARRVAALAELSPDFTWRLLCLLAEADAKGRIAPDIPELAERVQLAGMAAEEAGCADGPYPFADACAKYAYLSGRNVQPDQPLYDPSWGEVVLLSGLPGTGKDTWIRRNCPDLPAVSLDGIRRAMRIGPGDEQGAVVKAAKEQAKEYLRRKQPFVWNATNLTRETRRKLVSLSEQYGARVRIVWLETGWETRRERNLGRESAVPEAAAERMLDRTEVPAPDEAQAVEWQCV